MPSGKGNGGRLKLKVIKSGTEKPRPLDSCLRRKDIIGGIPASGGR
jgi:hypothetical protein